MTSHPDVPGFGAAQQKYDNASDDDRFLETKCPDCDGTGNIYCDECGTFGCPAHLWDDNVCHQCEGKGTVHPSTIEREE